MIRNVVRCIALSLLFIMMCFTINAQAETTQCTAITTVPYTITTSGTYCLTGDLISNTAVEAVQINASDVVIDLNGHTLSCVGLCSAGFNTAIVNNVTIKNGTIKGFVLAIQIDTNADNYGHLVEDIRAQTNGSNGIIVNASNSIIRNNIVTNTAGSSGIFVGYGSGNRVINNEVIESANIGIYVYSSNNTIIDGNRVGNQALGTGTTSGIYMAYVAGLGGSKDVLVTNNRVTRMAKGIYYDTGATGAYMNNLVFGATTAFTNGTRVGSTNFNY
jgi:parallel beta-helix repeat protein